MLNEDPGVSESQVLDRTTGRLEHDQLHKADQLLLLRHHVDGHLATTPPLSLAPLSQVREPGQAPGGPGKTLGVLLGVSLGVSGELLGSRLDGYSGASRSFSRSFWGASGESSRRLLGSLLGAY